VVCVALTSNVSLADAPGNVLIPQRRSGKSEDVGLTKDSVTNVSQIVTLDRSELTELAGRLTRKQLALVLAGVTLLLTA